MVKVILVRHGETDWNEARRIQGGSSNTPLNERGRKQAEGLALRLRQEKLQAIYASPLQRSLDTAKAIAYYHQLEVGIEPSCREIAAGQLEGVFTSELGKRLSEFLTTSVKGKALPKRLVVNHCLRLRSGRGALSSVLASGTLIVCWCWLVTTLLSSPLSARCWACPYLRWAGST